MANSRRPKSKFLQIRLTTKARRDLLDIWRGIAAHDPAVADRLYDRMEERISLLKDFPEAGVTKPELAPEARMLVERPYLIFYRVTPSFVQIVRVLHGARRIDKSLIDEGVE